MAREDKVRELLALKEGIQEREAEINRLKGQLEELTRQFQKFGCANLEQLEQKRESLEETLADLEDEYSTKYYEFRRKHPELAQ